MKDEGKAKKQFISEPLEMQRRIAELEESEKRYRMLVEDSLAGAYIRRENHLLDVNKRFLDIFGYSREELLEKPFLEFIHPDDIEMIQERAKERMEGKPFIEPLHFRVITKDGAVKWVETVSTQINYQGEPAILGNFLDITDRKLMEEALQESEERYRILVDKAKTGIYVRRGERFVFVNPRMEELTGYTEQELLEEHILNLIHPEDRESTQEEIILYDSGKGSNRLFQCRIVTKNGDTRWIEAYGTPVTFSGESATINNVLDITDRKLAEDALQERLRFEELLSDLSARFVHLRAAEVGPEINNALKTIVEFLEIDRSTILEFSEDKNQLRATHSWWREGIVPGVPMEADKEVPWFADKALSGETIMFSHLPEDLPDDAMHEKEFCLRDGLKSLAAIPLKIGDTILGIVTFSSFHSQKTWTVELTQRLQLIGEIFANAMMRKRVEDALKESEERYRTLVDSAITGIYVRRGDKLLFVNKRAAEISGYPEEELLNMPMLDVIHPEDRETVKKTMVNRDASEGPPEILQYRGITKDGEIRWIETVGTPIVFWGESAVLVNFHDITDRKKAEEEIQEREEQYRAVVDNSADYFMRYDRNFRHIYANPAAMKVTGLPPEEYIGKTHREMGFPEHLCKLWEENIQKVFDTGQSRTIEFDVELAEGSMYLELQLNPELSPDGTVKSVIGISRDMTERKRLEQQLLQAQKMESIGTLAGGIAHDFNNLLTSVLGNAEMALMRIPHFSPARKNLDEIAAAARHAADLCSQLLAYSGKGQFVIKAISLSELINEMSRLLTVSISQKAAFNCELDESVPPVKADPSQIHQTVINLITNASEALGDKGGVVTITTGAIECDAEYFADSYLGEELPEGTYAYIEVTDTGCGMSEEMIEKIFDPFFTTKFMGRGLGLAAVLGIVRGHRGAIKIQSEPGKGTVFRILFPCCEDPMQTLKGKGREFEEWSGSGTILVIDDEEMVRKIVAEMLESLGFDTMTAADGREALEMFRKHQDQIAIVLLDLTMPIMSGEEVFEEIKRIKGDARVVLSTGYTALDAMARFEGKDLAGFIQKPYKYEFLRKIFRNVLGE